ncbi:MAG: hypothetical protein LBI04_09630 [Treponema sp.]|jgi:hypothetical protein|nr:hypothetical protein [Treponema sp.]
MKNRGFYQFLLVLIVFCCLSPVYGADNQRPSIDINLIIDGSRALTDVKEEVSSWVIKRLDQLLVEGDRITVWSTGTSAKVIYTGKINSNADKDAVKKSIRDISGSGTIADFSGALRDAASRPSSGLCYTLLISASQQALSSLLSGSQAGLMRYSRVEEFSGWRAIVVGLNLDTKVKRAAAGFYGS